MAKSGKIIKVKSTSTLQNALSQAQNTGETWAVASGQPQTTEDQDALLKQVLPDLYTDNKPQKANLTFGQKDLYASMGLVENEQKQDLFAPVSTATPTTSFASKRAEASDKVDYASLPLYDDPEISKNAKPYEFTSKEEFQKYGKSQILSDITQQIKNAGGVGEDISQSALQDMVVNTIAASFLKKLGLDIQALPTNISYDKEGNVLYHGIKLDLDDGEKRVINDFNTERMIYHGENDSILKQAAMFVSTMALDLPVFVLNGGMAGAVVSKVPFLAESAAANSAIGRLAGTFAVNDLMFNALAIPKYIDIAQGKGTETILDEVWNNTKFAAGATIFGSVGLGFSKMAQSVFKSGESKLASFIQRYPSAFQELSMMGSSFTLGTAFPGDVDRNNE
ncbi:MAG: hypothetical protein ACYC2U_08850, partial [Candidatus Amoebophilus sp.]